MTTQFDPQLYENHSFITDNVYKQIAGMGKMRTCGPADQWMGKLRTKLADQVRTLPVGWHAVGTNLLKFYHMKCIPQCSRVLVDTGKIV